LCRVDQRRASGMRGPQWQVTPRHHPVRQQKVVAQPLECAAAALPTADVKQLCHGHDVLAARNIIGACETALEAAECPRRYVAYIDELNWRIGIAGCEDLAAFCDALGPVGEAPRWIVRPDYKTCAYEQCPTRKRTLDNALAGRLECTKVALVRLLALRQHLRKASALVKPSAPRKLAIG